VYCAAFLTSPLTVGECKPCKLVTAAVANLGRSEKPVYFHKRFAVPRSFINQLPACFKEVLIRYATAKTCLLLFVVSHKGFAIFAQFGFGFFHHADDIQILNRYQVMVHPRFFKKARFSILRTGYRLTLTNQSDALAFNILSSIEISVLFVIARNTLKF